MTEQAQVGAPGLVYSTNQPYRSFRNYQLGKLTPCQLAGRLTQHGKLKLKLQYLSE